MKNIGKFFCVLLLCAAALVGCGTNSVASKQDLSSVVAVTPITDSSSLENTHEVTDATPAQSEIKILSSSIVDSTEKEEKESAETTIEVITTIPETTTIFTETSPVQSEITTPTQSEVETSWIIVEKPIEVETTTEPYIESPNVEIDSYSYELLAQIVWHEAGSDWINTYDKAHIAAAVMNRVYDSRFPNTVYGVLTQPGQFSGYWPDSCTPTQACYDAIDYYYLANPYAFDSSNSWFGDGQCNYFYYQ